MKILKIIHGYPPHYNAGSEVYSQSICNELKEKHEIFIFTREENLYAADHEIREEIRENIHFFYVNKAREKDGYKHTDLDEKFAQILDKIQPDIAHIGHLNHLSTGLVAVLENKKIPIVFTLHDFWLMCPRGQFLQINFANPAFHQLCDKQENTKCATNCYNRYFSGQISDYERDINYWSSWVGSRMEETKSIINKVNLFIAPSKYLMNRFVADFGVPKEKIIYLDYGFPLHYLSPISNKKQESFTFGYIGTHIPAKGIDLLITAFSKITEKATLKIWGRENGQSTKNLKMLAQSCPNKVEFFGEYVNTNLANEVFANVDCIVVPSIWGENSPLVIHEAQACHIPVITADFGGMSEYVQHLENGLLFAHRNAEDLTEKMLFAIHNSLKMKELGKRGYLYHEKGEVPNIAEHCEKLVSLYQQILKNYQQ
jgi:glycosyltransferase involved in cell wall biosynthesis